MYHSLNPTEMIGKKSNFTYLAASYKMNMLKNNYNMVKLLKKSILAFLLVLPFLFSSQKAEATHVMGADITYKCLDSLRFEFTVTYYRACSGVPFSTPQTFIECSSGSPSRSVTPTFVGIKEITPVCATATGECIPQNTLIPGSIGIELHTYTVIVDFKVAPYSGMVGCGKVRLRTGQCCRNSNINTGGANQNFQTFAEIDLSQSHCNSSPGLTSDPIAILCCNQPFYFNNGALDTANFDSLSYSWAHPKGTGLANIGYSGTNYAFNHPFSAFYPGATGPPLAVPGANPPIGIFLDPITGDIIFTPSRCDEITIAVIEITEWRKDSTGVYRKIGSTRRDLQFITTACPDNNPPIINGPYLYNVCEGSQLCFNVTTDDRVFLPPPPATAPLPDTVKTTWNRGIPGASFTIINPTDRLQTGRFCWTPPAGSASDLPYTFTVTARDNACPLNAVSVRAFRVKVKHRAQTVVNVDTFICGKYSVESNPIDGFRGTPSYSWTLLDSNRNIVFDKKVGYFKATSSPLSTRVSDTLIFRTGGKYYIQHDITNNPLNCPTTYFDTLVVPPLLEADLSIGPDTFVCAGTDIVLRPFIKNTSPPLTYQWSSMGVTNSGRFLKNVTRNATDITDTFLMTVPQVRYDTGVAILITDVNGCTAEDSVQIFLKANPKAVLPPDVNICSYDSLKIVPNLDSAYWVDPILGDTLVQGDTLYKEWHFNFFTNIPFSTADSVTVNLPGTYYIRVYDSLGCTDVDEMIVSVNDTVKANAGLDQILCFNDPLVITAAGLDTVGTGKSGLYQWTNITTPPNVAIGPNTTYTFSATNNRSYKLDLSITEDGVTCVDDDTVAITVNQLPIIDLGPDQSVCCDYGNISLNFSINTPTGTPASGSWSCPRYPNLVQNNVFFTDLACGLITSPARSIPVYVYYTYRHPSTQCVNRDSMRITVNSLPNTILARKEYCQDIGAIRLDNNVVISPANTSLGTPSWRCLDSNSITNRFTQNMLENRGSIFAPNYWVKLDETVYTIQNPEKDTIVLEFTYINGSGCRTKDTVELWISRVPKITFASSDELCWDDGKVSLNTLTGVNLTDGTWTIYDSTGYRLANTLGGITGGDTINTLNSVPLTSALANPRRYILRYDHTATGCPARNDTTLTINPLPAVNLTALSPNRFCETASNQPLLANPAGGTWSSNDPTALVGGNNFSPANASILFPDTAHLTYRYTSPTTGCKNTDSIYALVDAQPTISTPAGTEFCRTKGVMSETLQFEVTATNTDELSWVTFNPSLTLGTVASQNVTMNYQNDSTEVFTIITNAAGRGVCINEEGFFNIIVHPIPDAILSNDNDEGCNPVTTNLGVDITNRVDPATSTFAWSLGDAASSTASTASTSVTYTTNGQPTASLTVTSAQGCDTTLSISTLVHPIPEADFLPNPDNYTTAALPRFQFNDLSRVDPVNGADITTWAWNFGDPAGSTSAEQNPSFFYPPDTGSLNVTLRVTTNHGCTDEFTYPVVIGPDLIVFIPNAFTPDFAGPADNEGFKAHISGEKYMQLTIFNRWGEIMFQTTDKDEKWNGIYKGELAQQDVYAYALKVTALNDEVYTYTGTITLIR